MSNCRQRSVPATSAKCSSKSDKVKPKVRRLTKEDIQHVTGELYEIDVEELQGDVVEVVYSPFTIYSSLRSRENCGST